MQPYPYILSTVRFAVLTALLMAGRASLLTAQKTDLPTETVVLSCDRQHYLAGEVIWFSASCTQTPATDETLSTTLYLELLNGQGQAVIQQKYALSAGLTSGGIETNEVLPSGHYFLRAYTQYQRNFPVEQFSYSRITLLNPSLSSPAAGKDSLFSFRFETGKPLVNVPVRMVVRMPRGDISADSLCLKDQHGTVVGRAQQAAGRFALMKVTAEADNSYFLEFHDTTGTVWRRKLPAAQAQGLTLRQQITPKGLSLTLLPTAALTQDRRVLISLRGPDFQLIAQQNTDLVVSGGTVSFSRDVLQKGRNYLFVADLAGNPLYATTFLWEEKTAPAPGISVSAKSVDEGTPFSVSLDLPAPGSYSVAVRKVAPVNVEQQLEHLWHNPWAMLSEETSDSPENLPLTETLISAYLLQKYAHLQAPTRLDWVPESRDLSISGWVKDPATGQPVAEVLTMVSMVGEHPQLHSQLSGADGSFRIPLRDLEGIETVFVGVKSTLEQKLEVLVNRDFAKEMPDIQQEPFSYDPELHRYFEALFVANQAARIFDLPETTPAYAPRSHKPLPFNLGEPNLTIRVDEFIELETMEELFQNIVPKVSVNGPPGNRHLAIYNDTDMSYEHDPLILLDQAAVFDVEALLGISPKKIARFEVFQGAYYLGDQRFEGIVSISTHTDDFARYPFGADGAFVKYTATQPGVAFEAIVTGAETPAHQPDLRTTLYWNPVFSGGISTLELVAPDVPGAYEVVVECLSGARAGEEFKRVFGVEKAF